MPQKGFVKIFIALIAAGLLVLFFTKASHYMLGGKLDKLAPRVNGASCSDGPVFTKIPIDPAKILAVTPLGNLNPPDHTIPTDHIYLVLKENNEIHPESATKVFAPSDLIISRVTHTTTKKSGNLFSDDYSIDFSPCKDIQAKFGHVTKISEKLESLLKKNKSSCQTQHPRPEDEYTYCDFELNEKISSGEQLGEAGGGTSTSLDFWTIDWRSNELSYANPERYNSYQLHTVCPIDLFEQDKKQILSVKFGRQEKNRTVKPLCGEINQDVAGTAQGNWTTADGYIDRPESWSKSLALVHDNVDPGLGLVSIGGVIGNPAKFQFTPTSSGNTNREFSQVVDNQTYCYQGESAGFNTGQSGKILIQLVDKDHLKVEYRQGTCDSNLNFNAPTTYQR